MPRPKVNINPICGKRLKEICDEQNISQSMLSEMIHISQQTISKMINGKSSLTDQTARIIVGHFTEYRLEWLLGYDDYKTIFDLPEFYGRFCFLCAACETTPVGIIRELGIDPSLLLTWQIAGGVPSFEHLNRIANRFSVTVDYLIGLTNDPHTRNATQADFDHFGEKEPPEGWELADSEREMLEKFKRLPLADRKRIELLIDYDFNRLCGDKKNI